MTPLRPADIGPSTKGVTSHCDLLLRTSLERGFRLLLGRKQLMTKISFQVSLGPLMFASKFVLVGDHYQLPPLVQVSISLYCFYLIAVTCDFKQNISTVTSYIRVQRPRRMEWQ